MYLGFFPFTPVVGVVKASWKGFVREVFGKVARMDSVERGSLPVMR